MDGGVGNDVIAGDNAIVIRQLDALTTLVRKLAAALMYKADGSANVTADPQANPTGAARRDITLLDHAAGTAAGLFGNDLIAGGADDDTIFGQLGDDVIQGDSSVAKTVSATDASLANAATDGDDYIEGNGGADLIFGDLGQDDIVGGSSSLFGLTTIDMRPDGSDTIFGGSGQDVARNTLGNAAAADADMIVGDNGDILRLSDGSGGFRRFNYDTAKTIIPRAIDLLDYSPTAANIGAGDLIHGEAGDDSIHGASGNDTLFGEGQSDDLFGEQGDDWISGGSGDDGVLGDDGKIYTSRNGTAEPMYGIAATTQSSVTVSNGLVSATLNPTGQLAKSVDLEPFDKGGNDTVYGGLGNDSLHGGAGNDGISGAEALVEFYSNPSATPLIVFDAATGNFLGFVDSPSQASLIKINGHPLNFDAAEADGADVLFGDLDNDWLVGGRGTDYLYGGLGNDIHNLDDNLETSGNDTTSTEQDVAFGGGGRDTLLANSANDRLIDWVGEFNTYITPFAPFGTQTVNRQFLPALRDFLLAVSRSQGADQTRVGTGLATVARNGEPFGELGMVEQQDQLWGDQTGGPTDGQAGNKPGGKK
jgi:Ca2+-binding RTX toxin-like protein